MKQTLRSGRYRRFTLGSCLGALLLSLVSTGCGGDDDEGNGDITDPVALCTKVAEIECARIFSCTTQQERADLGLTVDQTGCTLGLQINLRCTTATATGVCAGVGSVEDANACRVQALAASCDQIKANTTNVGAYAPKCVPCLVL